MNPLFPCLTITIYQIAKVQKCFFLTIDKTLTSVNKFVDPPLKITTYIICKKLPKYKSE